MFRYRIGQSSAKVFEDPRLRYTRFLLSSPSPEKLEHVGPSDSNESQDEVYASNLPSDAAPEMPTPPTLRRAVQAQPRKRKRRKRPTSAVDQRRESGVSVPIGEARTTRTSEDSSLIVRDDLLRQGEEEQQSERRVPNTDELDAQKLNEILASEDYRNAVYDDDFELDHGAEDELVTEQFRAVGRSNTWVMLAGFTLLSLAVLAGAFIIRGSAAAAPDQVWVSSRPQGAAIIVNGVETELRTPAYVPMADGVAPIISLELSGYDTMDARPLSPEEIRTGATIELSAAP